jgi:methylenetetrahydrofolate--tRNA-(uracil-5-)-methyltransferase
MESRKRAGLFFAGQITGVEGYVESIASGLVAAVSAAQRGAGEDPRPFPRESMIGALMERITTPGPDRPQPMNANFGLLPEVAVRRKRDRKVRKAEVALAAARRVADRGGPMGAVEGG